MQKILTSFFLFVFPLSQICVKLLGQFLPTRSPSRLCCKIWVLFEKLIYFVCDQTLTRNIDGNHCSAPAPLFRKTCSKGRLLINFCDFSIKKGISQEVFLRMLRKNLFVSLTTLSSSFSSLTKPWETKQIKKLKPSVPLNTSWSLLLSLSFQLNKPSSFFNFFQPKGDSVSLASSA